MSRGARLGSQLATLVGVAILGCASWASAAAVDVAALTRTIRAVAANGAGHREAIAAWKTLALADATQLPQILGGMDGAGPLAENWIRAAAESIAGRTVKSGARLPVADLEKFLAETTHSPRGRRLAYELIATVDPNAERRLIPGLLNDPSLELRRDAVAQALAKAADSGAEGAAADAAAGDKAKTVSLYRAALVAARDIDQVKQAVDKLKGLDDKPDVATHLGFVLRWKLVAPFDNAGTKGFDVDYPPEQGVDLKATYAGKSGPIAWSDAATDDDYGLLDLAKTLDKHKGAIAYAFAEFVAADERDVELRLGTPNANKIWLNGRLLATNHIYHSGRQIDQYVGQGRLKKGRNEILLKIAQNEQTENWAQDWQFQLRVCDAIGTAVLSLDRVVPRTAAAR